MNIEDKKSNSIIEKKSEKSHFFPITMLIVGVIIGAIIATLVSNSKWLGRYLQLEELVEVYQTKVDAADKRNESIDTIIEGEKQQALEEQKKELDLKEEQDKVEESKKMAVLNDNLSTLNSQKVALQQKIKEQRKEINKLTDQVNLQVTMLSSAKQLFQRQLQLKEEASALQAKIEVTSQNEEQLSKECQIYLNGKSWDTKSDACERQEKAKSQIQILKERLKKLNLDIKEIDNVSNSLGVE